GAVLDTPHGNPCIGAGILRSGGGPTGPDQGPPSAGTYRPVPWHRAIDAEVEWFRAPCRRILPRSWSLPLCGEVDRSAGRQSASVQIEFNWRNGHEDRRHRRYG